MSEPAAIYFYGDRRSLERIGGPGDHVLLAGGYVGYANFGDILQLKGAIRWHRQRTGLDPVVVCDVNAIHDAEFINDIRRWFGIESILFHSRVRVDLTPLGLNELTSVPRISRLHVYGGGFLNQFWCGGMLELIEALHARFGVGHYVLSGQQVGPEIKIQLTRHFAHFPPLIAGGRDPDSVEHLAAAGAPAGYSFDDATEPLQVIVRSIPQRRDGEQSAFIHLNLSSYANAGNALDRLHDFSLVLRRLRDYLDRNDHMRPSVTLLHAYEDCRVDQVTDTLGVVQQLEHRFPFRQYQVLDLAALARDLWVDESPNRMASVAARIAISCSYHTSIFCSLMGVPCFLQTFNAYYRQKKEGLGFNSGSLEEFLENPQLPDLRRPLLAREDWLTQLESAYGKTSSNAAPVREWSLKRDEPISPWIPKSAAVPQIRISGLSAENARLTAEVNRLAEQWEQQKLRIQQLEEDRDRIWNDGQSRIKEMEQTNIEMWGEVQRLGQELQRVGQVCQEQHAHITELDATKNRIWQESRQRISELEEVKDRLWTELQQMQERLKQNEEL